MQTLIRLRVRSLSCLFLPLLALVTWSRVASAEPYCPGTNRTVTINDGMVLGQVVTKNYRLSDDPDPNKRMYPCDMFWIEAVATDYGPESPPQVPSSFHVDLKSVDNTYIGGFGFGVPAGQSNSGMFPAVSVTMNGTSGKYFGTAFPATRLDLLTVQGNAYNGGINYTITVHLISRPGYNRGGTSIATALVVQNTAVTLSGTLGSNDFQYHKVTLPPGGRVIASGTITNWYPGWPTYYRTRFYNASGTYLQGYDVTVPAQSTNYPFANHAYTNTGSSPLDVWVAFYDYALAWADFRITLQVDGLPSPQLSLFLDADSNFNVSNPQSDIGNYVPGSVLATGESEPVSVMAGTGQQLQLIAAYVDASGQIVAPANAGDVTFSLAEVSAFTGIAMNYGTGAGSDFALPGPVCPSGMNSCAPFAADSTARVTLLAYDYGGFAVVSAAHAGGTAAVIRLPKDDGVGGGTSVNWLPDAGYQGPNEPVTDALQPWEDGDQSSGNTNHGDGLTAFEEYRGFIRGGQHVRLSPLEKDLFVLSELPQGYGYASNLGIRVWLIEAAEMGTDRVINPNNQGLPGAASPPYVQRALHIQDGVYSTLRRFGETAHLTPATPARVVAPIKIFTEVIRELSPPTFSQYVPAEPYDDSKTSDTIAHEIGHGLNLDDVQPARDQNGTVICPNPPVHTVMLTDWIHATVDANNQIIATDMCRWQNLPYVYLPTELAGFRLK